MRRRWIVVVEDMPPMPQRGEIHARTFTRRGADHEASMLRIAFNRSIARRLVRVRVMHVPAQKGKART